MDARSGRQRLAGGLALLLAAGLTAGCPASAPGGAGPAADGGPAAAVPSAGAKGLHLGISRGQLAGGRVPQLAELTQLIGQRLGDAGPVAPLVTADYGKLSTALQGGTVQLAWLPPLEVARSVEGGAHVLLVAVRRGSPTYRAALLVKSGGAVKTAADLRGKTVGWVDRHSAAGYLFARDWLLSKGLGQGAVKDQFLGSHKAVCEALMKGEVLAAATWMNERPAAAEGAAPAAAGSADRVDGCWQEVGAGSDRLTLIDQFGPIPGDALVASKDLAPALRERLITDLQKLHELPRGAALLRDLFGAERLAPATDEGKNYRMVAEVRDRLHAAGVK